MPGANIAAFVAVNVFVRPFEVPLIINPRLPEVSHILDSYCKMKLAVITSVAAAATAK